MSISTNPYYVPYGGLQAQNEELSRTITILARAKESSIYPNRWVIFGFVLSSPMNIPLQIGASLIGLIERIIAIGKLCFTDVDNKGGRLCHKLICLILIDPLTIIWGIASLIVLLAASILGLCCPPLFLYAAELMMKGDYLLNKFSLTILKRLVPSPLVPKNPTPHALESPLLAIFNYVDSNGSRLCSIFDSVPKTAIELWQKMAENQRPITESRERLIQKTAFLLKRLWIQDSALVLKIARNDIEIWKRLKLSIQDNSYLLSLLNFMVPDPNFDVVHYIQANALSNEKLVSLSKALITIFHFSEKQGAPSLYLAADRAFIQEIEQELPIVYGLGVAIY